MDDFNQSNQFFPEPKPSLGPEPDIQPERPKKKIFLPAWSVVLIVVIFVASLGFGIYKAFFSKPNEATKEDEAESTEEAELGQEAGASEEDLIVELYQSYFSALEQFNLDWLIANSSQRTKGTFLEAEQKLPQASEQEQQMIGGLFEAEASLYKNLSVHKTAIHPYSAAVYLKSVANIEQEVTCGLVLFKKESNDWKIDARQVTSYDTKKSGNTRNNLDVYNNPCEKNEQYVLNMISFRDEINDPDTDGLNNQGEEKFGTDPKRQDTDGDGHSDYSEIINGYDPLRAGD